VESGLEFSTAVFGPLDVALNMTLAGALGIWISVFYKRTHRGLSYSQSFMLTVILVALVVSMVMMVIGNSLARAFALVGALSIIRFRTVVKDTKDTAYIFAALAVGMASGTGSHLLAIVGTAVFSVFVTGLHISNYGALITSEFILRFRAESGAGPSYEAVLKDCARRFSLLQSEPSADGHATNLLTFDVILRKGVDTDEFVQRLNKLDQLSEIVLIASKTDVDY
jgi:uncharacterized membrane protein YhiD involved in acid resistance